MSFFRRKGDDSEYPERIIAVPDSDYEKKLRADDDFEELSHADFKATFTDAQWAEMPEAVQQDTQPNEHPKVPRQAQAAPAKAAAKGKAPGSED